MAPKRSAASMAAQGPPSFLVKLTKRDLEALTIPASVAIQDNVELELLPSRRRYFVVTGAGVFGSGWKAFCKNNGIKEGDSIVFKASKKASNVLTCKVYGPDGCLKQDASDGAGSSSRKRTRDELISSEDEDDNLEAALADGINAALAVRGQEREIVFTNCEIRLSVKKLGGQIRSETPASKTALPAKPAAAAAPSPARTSRSAAAKNKEDLAVAGSKGKRVPGKKDTAASPTPEPETKKAAVPKRVAAKAATAVKKSSSAAAAAKKISSERKAASAARAAALANSPRKTTSPASKKPASPAPKKAASPRKVATPQRVSPARSRLESKLDAAATPASPSKTPIKPASRRTPKASPLKVEKTVMTKRPGVKSPSKSSGKKPAPVQTAAEAKALARARSFTSANPHEVLVMKKSNLAPSFLLALPRTFARESLPQEIEELEMLNEEDKAWNVRWLPSPKMTFSGGWVYFAQDNKLETGDVCVIELLGQKRVKMHIFRASESGSADGDAANDETAAKEKVVHTVEAVTVATTTTTTVAAAAIVDVADDDDDDDDYHPEEEEDDEEAGPGGGRRPTPAPAAAGPTSLDVPPVSMVAPAS